MVHQVRGGYAKKRKYASIYDANYGIGFHYSIQNLRSIRAMPDIELKKINILVGMNSIGKSTFLRSIWLLKRSLTGRSSAPVLWYGGQGDQIDFGDFKSAVHMQDLNSKIGFSFGFTELFFKHTEPRSFGAFFPVDSSAESASGSEMIIENVKIQINVGYRNGHTVKDEIIFSFNKGGKDFNYKISYGEKMIISINGESINNHLDSDLVIYDPSDNLFPSLSLFKKNGETYFYDHVGPIDRYIFDKVNDLIGIYNTEDYDSSFLASDLFMRGIDTDFEWENLEGILLNAWESIEGNNDEVSRKLNDIWENRFSSICMLFNLLLLNNILTVFNALCHNVFVHTKYIGPSRTNTERFYRFQELQVFDIEPDGSNFAMWLGSLSEVQLNKFSEFLGEVLGSAINLKRSEGNVSILVEYCGKKVNIADTGFGFSQILPVLGQIWLCSPDYRSNLPWLPSFPSQSVLIEQPELHLHPALQAKLANSFVLAASHETGPAFVIETHSEALINRFGDLVIDGKLDPDDIQILVFEDKGPSYVETGRVEVKISTFNEKGRLLNWPVGFFNW